jgi:hypothetical protein
LAAATTARGAIIRDIDSIAITDFDAIDFRLIATGPTGAATSPTINIYLQKAMVADPKFDVDNDWADALHFTAIAEATSVDDIVACQMFRTGDYGTSERVVPIEYLRGSGGTGGLTGTAAATPNPLTHALRIVEVTADTADTAGTYSIYAVGYRQHAR